MGRLPRGLNGTAIYIETGIQAIVSKMMADARIRPPTILRPDSPSCFMRRHCTIRGDQNALRLFSNPSQPCGATRYCRTTCLRGEYAGIESAGSPVTVGYSHVMRIRLRVIVRLPTDPTLRTANSPQPNSLYSGPRPTNPKPHSDWTTKRAPSRTPAARSPTCTTACWRRCCEIRAGSAAAQRHRVRAKSRSGRGAAARCALLRTC